MQEALGISALRFFPRDLGAFLTRFRETDCDRLLPARNPTSLTAFAGPKCAVLSAPHRALYAFASRFSVSRHRITPLLLSSVLPVICLTGPYPAQQFHESNRQHFRGCAPYTETSKHGQ
jgi:hypothetical protein